jgi:hypothetical protein
MQRQNTLDVFERAFLNQLLSALPFFFARLEDGAPRKRQIIFLLEGECSRQEHGRMRIVTAGVHYPGVV